MSLRFSRHSAVAAGLVALIFVIDVTPVFAAPALEEILVTARKREESAQDVPVAIQAFDAESIERFGATNLNEIADLATQVQMYPGSSGNGANFVVRGYGSTSLDPGIESSVGVNIDGVQVDRGHIVRQAFFDMGSVEVLKGPQALFFGKNSPAGVISAISALPTEEFEAKLTFGYEAEADEKILEGMISGRITDTLNARFAFRVSDADGWIENTAQFIENSNGEVLAAEPFDFPGGANDLGSERLRAGRLTLDWNPTDNFNGTLRILRTSMDNDGFQTNENNNCSGPLPVSNGIADPFGDCKLDGKTAHGSLPREIASTYSRDIGNGDPVGEFDSTLATLKLEYALDWGTITSVTGFMNYDYFRFDNFDGTTYNFLLGAQWEEQDQLSQEIRLLTQFDSPLNFMVGAFYETFERDSDNAGKIAALGFDPVTGFSNTWEGISTVESDSYSVYAQAIWNINDQWELAGGARYTDDQKEFTQGNNYVHTVFGPAVLNILLAPGLEVANDFGDTEVSPEVTLTYRPNDDMTIWGAYKTGYKSGGFSTNTVLSSASTGPGLTFQPEDAEGFEVGVKSTLADGRLRLNATAYRYEFNDIQISVFDSATTSFSVDNAATATTTGIEFESIYAATDGLTLRAQVGFNEGEYDSFPGAACSVPVDPVCDPVSGTRDLSGEPLTRAPEIQGSVGFDYYRTLGTDWALSLAAEGIYSDEYQTNTNNNPLAIQDSFWRYNARVAIGSTDGTWDFSLIGRNISNEYYQGGQADKPGGTDGRDLFGGIVRPRQILLQMTYALAGQ